MSFARLQALSYGVVSAVVASVGVITGFQAAGARRPTMLAALLIVGVADNLTDSLSIHVYQESENMPGRAALISTTTNFLARALVVISFCLIVIEINGNPMTIGCIIWGATLLCTMTWSLARHQGKSVRREIALHLTVSAVVIITSRAIGQAAQVYFQ